MLLIVKELLNRETVEQIAELAERAEFRDGRDTAGRFAAGVKKNEQARADDPASVQAGERILKAVAEHPRVASALMPRHIRQPLLSRYGPGMHYGDHTDNALMPGAPIIRTDYSMTLFLSDPDSYEGGELVINSEGDGQTVKLPAGSAVFYPSGTQHRVNEVTSGTRLAAITWIQSVVRDPAKREILAELNRLRVQLGDMSEAEQCALTVQKLRSNLMRMWADV